MDNTFNVFIGIGITVTFLGMLITYLTYDEPMYVVEYNHCLLGNNDSDNNKIRVRVRKEGFFTTKIYDEYIYYSTSTEGKIIIGMLKDCLENDKPIPLNY